MKVGFREPHNPHSVSTVWRNRFRLPPSCGLHPPLPVLRRDALAPGFVLFILDNTCSPQRKRIFVAQINRYIDNQIDQGVTITSNATSIVFNSPISPDTADRRGVLLVSAGGATGTSPTLTFALQASLDGVVWFNCGSVQLTGAGSQRLEFHAVEPFFQVVKTVGGTSPSFTNVVSHLVFLK